MSKILAIDLGKFNSAVCIFDRSSLKSKFKTIRTRKQIMHDLFVEYQDDIETRTGLKTADMSAVILAWFQDAGSLGRLI